MLTARTTGDNLGLATDFGGLQTAPLKRLSRRTVFVLANQLELLQLISAELPQANHTVLGNRNSLLVALFNGGQQHIAISEVTLLRGPAETLGLTGVNLGVLSQGLRTLLTNGVSANGEQMQEFLIFFDVQGQLTSPSSRVLIYSVNGISAVNIELGDGIHDMIHPLVEVHSTSLWEPVNDTVESVNGDAELMRAMVAVIDLGDVASVFRFLFLYLFLRSIRQNVYPPRVVSITLEGLWFRRAGISSLFLRQMFRY